MEISTTWKYLEVVGIWFGPLIAVALFWLQQHSKTVEERCKEKHGIFWTLVTTQGIQCSIENKNAFNDVPKVFGNSETIMNAWKLCLVIVNESTESSNWMERYRQSNIDLLLAISRDKDVNVKISEHELRAGMAYQPKWYVDQITGWNKLLSIASQHNGVLSVLINQVELQPDGSAILKADRVITHQTVNVPSPGSKP